MKKLIILLLSAFLLTACSQSNEASTSDKANEPKQEKKAEVKEEPKQEVKKEEVKEDVKKEIDTSVFAYAKKVEVTDAINTNQHVTVFVHMSEETKPGLATQHVINQTYDFLQQPDLEGAKTITIAVKQGDKKIAQITVNKEAFTPNDAEQMSRVVLSASEIEFMTDEVKEYGANLGSW